MQWQRRQSGFDQRRLYSRFQRPIRFRRVIKRSLTAFEPAQAGKAGGNKMANQSLEREAKKDVVKAYARTPGAGPALPCSMPSGTGSMKGVSRPIATMRRSLSQRAAS